MNKNISKYAFYFLRWFCPDHMFEEIEGDLIQKFQRDVGQVGKVKAERRLVWNTIRFFRPGIIIRNRFSIRVTPFYMLSHFLKVFLRTTIKNGGYSAINIIGLTIGLVCSLFILMWVSDELEYDKFHSENHRIYKVMSNHNFPSGIVTYDDTPGLLAPGLKDLPEVEESCRMTYRNQLLVTYRDKSIYGRAVYADPSIFEIFTIPLLTKGTNGPLHDNNSVVISHTLAKKHFGSLDPVGKLFRIDNTFEAKVTAVFRDLPDNSSIRFDLIIPYSVYAKGDQYNNEWGAWTGGQTFVKLYGGSDIQTVAKKIHERFTKPNIWVRWDSNVELFLFPFADLRLYDNFENGVQDGGRITYVVALSLVAVFILLIACINFMNLATARSMNRAREIGVRKVVGAARGSLIRQFLGESILISFISLLISILLVLIFLPAFNQLTEKNIQIDYTRPGVWGALIGIAVLTGVIAGSYPAFLLSSFKPLNILKGTFYGFSRAVLRRVLVVFQFSVSIMLIIFAVVIYLQIDYMRTKNLGFDRENILYFNSNEGLKKHFKEFRHELLQNNSIKVVGQSDENPMEIFSGMVLADNGWPGKTKEDNVIFKYLRCDFDLLPALGFTFLDGRNFSIEFPSDSNNYIINEEAARRMKLTDPVGQYIVAPTKGQIVGLIKDFHSTGLKGPVEPVIIAMRPDRTDRIFVRYESGELDGALAHIRTVYKTFEADFPLEVSFMDATFDQQYKDEIMTGRIAATFTTTAILISTLGLFGLASFTAEKRAKEIGVRKVMGATAIQMVILLCKDFIQLIAIALVIGLPVSWWIMQEFLNDYAFHTEPGLILFAVTAVSMIGVAIIAVSYQSARAALTNPAKTLRSD